LQGDTRLVQKLPDSRTWRLYDILQVAKAAPSRSILRAYRELARKCHPDKEGGSTQRFQELAKAYAVLIDPEQRLQYDAVGDAGSALAEPSGKPPRDLAARLQGWLHDASRLPEVEAVYSGYERVVSAAGRLRGLFRARQVSALLSARLAKASSRILPPYVAAEVCADPPALVLDGEEGLCMAFVPDHLAPLADLAAAAEVGSSGDILVVLLLKPGCVARPTSSQLEEIADLVTFLCDGLR
jgi:hypothetical protein